MIECVLDVRARLGECPVWSQRDQNLYWVDIDSRLIHRYDPATDNDETRSTPGRPGAIALTSDSDRLLVAAEHDLVDFIWSSGEATQRLSLEPADSPTRLNDGRCDPVGRFWVGSMDDPSAGGHGSAMLHSVDSSGATRVVETGVGVSNGLAFSPDGKVMYWADSAREIVWSYDYDLDTGDRSNEQIFLDFADLAGKPDGACVDESGCYWVACVYGWALLRVTPAGTIDRKIDLPVEKPSMPAFGGSDLHTLYLTSISTGGSRAAAPGQPLAGALLALSVGVAGLAEPVFAG